MASLLFPAAFYKQITHLQLVKLSWQSEKFSCVLLTPKIYEFLMEMTTEGFTYNPRDAEWKNKNKKKIIVYQHELKIN